MDAALPQLTASSTRHPSTPCPRMSVHTPIQLRIPPPPHLSNFNVHHRGGKKVTSCRSPPDQRVPHQNPLSTRSGDSSVLRASACMGTVAFARSSEVQQL